MLSNNSPVIIFGEALFDCFEGIDPVLGGAPFNVAWHLQAFGAQAHFLSAVGNDHMGQQIIEKMTAWGMDTSLVGTNHDHPTGTVNVEVIDNEPHYTIEDDVAWDHISDESLPSLDASSLLYHGSLALRHESNRELLAKLTSDRHSKHFIDVNLRDPWWNRDSVVASLQYAECVKLNVHELRLLSDIDFSASEEDAQAAAEEFRIRNNIVDILVTRGSQGAFVVDRLGDCISSGPVIQNPHFVDTVGAGDAFSAVAILGLLNDWGWQTTLARAQEFASFVVGQQGAICPNIAVYHDFKNLWGMG